MTEKNIIVNCDRYKRKNKKMRLKNICFVVVLSMLMLPVPNSSYAIPMAKEFTLDNGLKVIYLELHSLPILRVSLGFRGGTLWESEEKAGLGAITFRMLDQGTSSKSALDIANKIDFVGGTLHASAGKDFSTVELSVLSKDKELGLEILSDILLNPTFPENELKRIKKEAISIIKGKNEDPGTIARERFNKIIYRDHYSRPLEGNIKSVEKITRDDLLRFYKRVLRPQLATLVVVGDIDEKYLREKLSGLFSSWQRSELSIPKELEQKVYVPKKVRIEKELAQTTVILGHTGMKRDNPDYYATYVMNYILGGGGFASRMMQKIRDEKGLVYSVYSYFSSMYYGGGFYVFAQTKNKTAKEAVQLINAEIRRIIKDGVKDSELADAKSYIMGSFPLKLDTTSKIASYLSYIEEYNLGLDYFEKFPEKIRAVTARDIVNVAKKYLHPNKISEVIVGGKVEKK